ncbi:MAG: exosortase/archaeosortase family protein [Patescibacteria group bacterium]|nr:exosortase/archaeosortase family protein [Patescibacteria group bacterium]
MDRNDGKQPPDRSGRGVNLLIVVALGGLLASVYAPLLLWLGRATISLEQLHNGGLIVLFALFISLRQAMACRAFRPEGNNLGVALVAAGLGSLYLIRIAPALALPIALLSFCLAFAGLAAFLFGTVGVRALLPAVAGILLLGILAGVAPWLDWPLRAVGAKYSALVLDYLGADVAVGLKQGSPPELLLAVKGRLFVVAAECNGFGLIASSLLVAAILGFHYRLAWTAKLALFIMALPLAILFNAFRIVGICLAATHLPLPYMLIHEGIGLFFYTAALLLLWRVASWRAEVA